MNSGRWEMVREVFRGALERDPEGRRGYLRQACAGDHGLCGEVESLLAAHLEAVDFLERPRGTARLVASPAAGRRIGAYEIERRIGRGGMGTVYSAVRTDEAFDKRVAIKLLRPDLDRDEIVRRFEAERRILARLDHPHVARLLDGGTTDDGLPYFVMEHVDGEPIDEYCDARRLSVSERLELFRTVCAAVQYAHRNLVVHRDLKPSNILVTGDGQPKLLDFGIAKILDPWPPPSTRTATALRFMTPDYASPEQVRGEPVTTASDVYSLGVLLYLLLAGSLPFGLRDRSPVRVRVEAPEPPSRVVGRPLETLVREGAARTLAPESIAGRRRSDPARLVRRLSGDLDNIVLMALREEPERRYASAEQLAADLDRHLRGHPVLACRDTLPYRWGKFFRRHRLAVLVGAAYVVAVLGFGIVMALQRSTIAGERDQAEAQRLATEAERRRADQATAFLVELFQASDPYDETAGADVTAREFLRRGGERLASELADQPELRAELGHTIGVIYGRLGLFDEAVPLLESALETRREVRGGEHPEVAESLDELGLVLAIRADYPAAEEHLRQALALRRHLFGDRHVEVAASLEHLGGLLEKLGDFRAAERLYRQALAIRQELLGPRSAGVAESLLALALNLKNQGEYEGAEPHYREALAIHRGLLGDEHVRVALDRVQLSHLLLARGDYEAAESLYRQSLPALRRAFGDEHVEVAYCLHSLAMALAARGEPEAEGLFREALTLLRQRYGPEHPNVVATLSGLARYLHAAGDLDEAERLYRRGLAIRRQALGDHSPYVALSLTNVAGLLVENGDFASAEPLLREALAISRRAFPGGHWRIHYMETLLAECLIAYGRYAEAEPLLLAGYEALRATKGGQSNHARRALSRLVHLYREWGKPAKAEEVRAWLPR